MIQTLSTIGTALGVSFTSGINLYATVLVIGGTYRLGWVDQLPGSLEVMGQTSILVLAGVLYLGEFLIDKIPGFDSIWDLVHTFIRPLLGAALAYSAVQGSLDEELELAVTLLCGGVAFTSHSLKTGTRLVVNASPEPVSNSAVSVIEDVMVVSAATLALQYPFLSFILILTIILLIAWFLPRIVRNSIFYFRTLLSWPMLLAGQKKEPDPLPEPFKECVPYGDNSVSVSCMAVSRDLPGGSRRGYLCEHSGKIAFVYRRFAVVRKIEFAGQHVKNVEVTEAGPAVRLKLVFAGGKKGWSFVTTRSRASLVRNIEKVIHSSS